MVQMVLTSIGEVPDVDLTFKSTDTDHGETVTTVREWTYIGEDEKHREHISKVVRRDVWVVMKTGVSMDGKAEL